MRTSFYLSDVDFVHVFKALSRGQITDGHVSLMMVLSMYVPSPMMGKNKDNSREIQRISRVVNAHPTTVVKRLRFLSENEVIQIEPSYIRSDSRISVKKVSYDRLPFIEVATKSKRGNTKTEKIISTIGLIKSLLPGIKRNFSAHPKFYTPLWDVMATGVDIPKYVRWICKNYSYFSLGLFCSSYTFQKFQENQKMERYKHPEKDSRRENEEDESKFWEGRNDR